MWCICLANDLPGWHFRHRGVKGGYRKCPTFYSALVSLFYWHNESVNIWSHYIAAALLSLHVYSMRSIFEHHSTLQAEQAVVVTCWVGGNILPMIFSAFCHQFYCVNKKWHTACWFLDFFGILSGMLFGGVSFIYLAFYCNPELMFALLYVLIVGYILSIQWCWKKFRLRTRAFNLYPFDRFARSILFYPVWYGSSEAFNLSALDITLSWFRFPEFSSFLCTYGAVATGVPLLLTAYVCREYLVHSAFRSIYLLCALGPMLMACGIIFFAQGHFPERFCNQFGVPIDFFDIIGHSHQWWHIVSALLMFFWIDLTAKHYQLRLDEGCVFH